MHAVKGFHVVSEAVDAFLETPCFSYDPTDIGNLISGSSAFSKSSLYIWKFLVNVLLKSSFQDFERYLASKWNEHNLQYFEHSVALPFFGIVMKNWPFLVFGHCWVLKICWHIECNTLTASSFRI